MEKLQDEYEKLQVECDEKWDLVIAADNGEWEIIEKMLKEIDEFPEKEDEIWNKYGQAVDETHTKNSIAWQAWKEASTKLEEKRAELDALRNKLFEHK